MFPFIIALSLFFTIPNLISAENITVPATKAQASGYLESLIERFLEYDLSPFGKEPLQPENEAFIRSIMEELNYTRPLIIRKMNRYGMSVWSRTNLVVILDRYVFVGESFFKELSLEEQRFVFGHELAHCMHYHDTINTLLQWAAKFMAIGIGIAAIRKLNALQFDAPLACYLGFAAGMVVYVASTFGTKMIERRNEIIADYVSATRLNAKDGGIAFLKTIERHTVYDYSKLLNRLFEGHPSPAQRIALLENITNTNS